MSNSIVISSQPSNGEWPELVTAITKLHPVEGDILVVDPDLVDPATLQLPLPGVHPVPIIFAPDGSLSLLNKADAKSLLEEVINSPGDDTVAPDAKHRICAVVFGTSSSELNKDHDE